MTAAEFEREPWEKVYLSKLKWHHQAEREKWESERSKQSGSGNL